MPARRSSAETLTRYRQKRDFARTAEPRGTGPAGRAQRLAFVVQKHAARRLHHDFRLEYGGALKSWAVPKGPSLDPHERRLAVHVEDHPLDYRHFEGAIPAGEYGAGEVIIWDRGYWEPLEDAAAGLERGHLKFRLYGERLHGTWVLAKMKGRAAAEGQDAWLLIKERDAEARSGPPAEITTRFDGSVVSRRTLATAAGRAEAHADPMPATLRPQLAGTAEDLPDGADWRYEIKYDGYRILARLRGGTVTLLSRNSLDWTARFKSIATALRAWPVETAWLDGEVVVFDPRGHTNFQALQNALEGAESAPLTYCLFDLPYLDGRDLRALPLAERQQRLRDLYDRMPGSEVLRYADHLEGRAQDVVAQACALGLEGLIAKRPESPYVSGRNRSWLKLKCRHRQEFVIGGYTQPAGSRAHFGALLLGVHDQGQLRYTGRVGTGFDERTLRSLYAKLHPLTQPTSPFANPPPARGVQWVKPQLVAEVEFAEWTQEGLVRQAAFLALRSDKPPATIVREPTPQPPPARKGRVSIAGIALTHPERVVEQPLGLTKSDLARYYETVADWLLPQLEDRPLALVRCPEHVAAPCFFQKHPMAGLPEAVRVVEIQQTSRRERFMVTGTAAAVVGLVQMGIVEFHTYGNRVDKPDRPDRVTFDLDPGPEVAWSVVVDSARLLRAVLQEFSFESFVKATGGKGLHVVMPLLRVHDWQEVHRFARAVATHLTRSLPELFTARPGAAHRTDRIFIDFLRNSRGATAIAAYSARARPGLPVAVALDWDELGQLAGAAQFSVANVPQRLAQLRRDPWQDYRSVRQRLSPRIHDALRGRI